jgi:actin
MFKGLGTRLKKEVSALAPSTMNICMEEPLERKYSVWIGGSLLSTIDSFNSIWITKD